MLVSDLNPKMNISTSKESKLYLSPQTGTANQKILKLILPKNLGNTQFFPAKEITSFNSGSRLQVPIE